MNATRSHRKSSKSSARRSKSSAKPRAGAKSGARKSAGSTRGATSSSRKSARGASSRSRTPIGQAIEILMNDHKKVQTLFRRGERAKQDKEKLRAIVEEACEAITTHADIEEQHFYPVMRKAGKDTDLIAEAEVEHTSAKQLIAELESGDPEEEQYAATFKVLGEYVKHHIKEEEGEIFPRARRARGDFTALLAALQARDEAEQAERTGGPGGRAEAGSRAAEAEQSSGSSSRRGREGRGRRSSRGRATGEAETPQATAEAGAESGGEGDIEQPRRGRRGESEESGETETPIHGGDQESVGEDTRGSRQGR